MPGLWRCSNCEWIGAETEMRAAAHPFIVGETMHGCPECGDVDFDSACDEPGCRQISTCGTPTADGYRRTCGKHDPRMATANG